MNILVLGHKGMLGNAVHKFLENKKITVLTTESRWPSKEFKSFIKECDCDFVINCIGSIPQRKTEFSINYELPIWLEEETGFKIIHPGTDCEVDSDQYGCSKRRSAEYIVKCGVNTKIIKTSIIGHEVNSSASLLDWFLKQTKQVNGYNNHFWNGNTTLQWSKVCYDIVKNWESYDRVTTVATEIISKYRLLNIISHVYEKQVLINDYTHEKSISNKCLVGNVPVPNIQEQLVELKQFYKKGSKT